MSEQGLDPLSLDNQLCFPLYVVSRQLTHRYKPLLDPLGLTYPQYVTMMALWEHDGVTISELGRRIHLDSATLTPLLKRLEAHGHVMRTRSSADERAVIVTLTDSGRDLRSRALAVPASIGACIDMDPEDAVLLKRLLDQLLACLSKDGHAEA